MMKKYAALLLSFAAAASLCGTPALAEETTLEPINPSDYLIQDISSYLDIGDLTGLTAIQYSYAVTDDMIQEQISSELYAAAEETEVSRPAQTGDIIYCDLTSTVQGDEDSTGTETTYVSLGDEEYGADFDAAFMGASAGDTLNFTITFDDQIWVDSWAEQTVDFEAAITSVNEVIVPELTDEFIAENTDCTTISEYEEEVRANLEADYADSAYADAVEMLFTEALDQTVFSSYPQDLYVKCQEETLSFYSMFAGTDDPNEICDLFGITTDELNEEILQYVNHRLFVSAICENEGLVFSEQEYIDYVKESAAAYGYPDIAEFEAESGREALVWSLLESKAGKYLYDHAGITFEEGSLSDDREYEEIDFGEVFEDIEFETE